MPRLAILFEYPTLLGGERSLLAVIKSLSTTWDVLAIAPPHGPLAAALQAYDIPLLPSPLFDNSGHKRPSEEALLALGALTITHAIDHLHANSLAMGRVTGRLAPRIASRCTAHLRDIIKLSKRAMGDLNGNARLLAVSEATRDYHIRQGMDPTKVTTIYNGIDTAQFRPRPRAIGLRRALDIPDDAIVTLTIGQISLRKGWDTLAAAMELAASRRPSLHALLVGRRYATKQETIDYEDSIRHTFNRAMPGRVRFLGERHDIPELLAAADLLIHPARQEPFGRVLLEAAASGCPIIATDVGGTKEMLGETAFLVPSDNPAQLADAIETLANNSALRRHLASAARSRIETQFHTDESARAFARVLGENEARSNGVFSG